MWWGSIAKIEHRPSIQFGGHRVHSLAFGKVASYINYTHHNSVSLILNIPPVVLHGGRDRKKEEIRTNTIMRPPKLVCLMNLPLSLGSDLILNCAPRW